MAVKLCIILDICNVWVGWVSAGLLWTRRDGSPTFDSWKCLAESCCRISTRSAGLVAPFTTALSTIGIDPLPPLSAPHQGELTSPECQPGLQVALLLPTPRGRRDTSRRSCTRVPRSAAPDCAVRPSAPIRAKRRRAPSEAEAITPPPRRRSLPARSRQHPRQWRPGTHLDSSRRGDAQEVCFVSRRRGRSG